MRERNPAARSVLRLAGAVVTALVVASPAGAETLESALSRAYQANPALNAARANLRATDEDVNRFQAGYRPNARSRPISASSSSRARSPGSR